MKLSTLLRAGAALILPRPAIIVRRPGEFRGRAKVRDVAITFHAPGGFPGRVNRTHPVSLTPYVNDPTHPVLLYGLACLFAGSANTVRSILSSDSAITAITGVVEQPFPFQASTGTAYGGAALGVAVPPVSLPVDVMLSGFMTVTVNGAVVLGGAVDVWFAASSGNHVQGGFEAAHTGGSSATLAGNTYWNGPADANNNAELVFNV